MFKPMLLATWLDYKARHLDRPAMWSMEEVVQNSRHVIHNNLGYTNAYNWRRGCSDDWYTLRGKFVRREFAKQFNQAIKDDEFSEACLLINKDEFRLIKRNCGRDWVEFLRDKLDTDDIYSCTDCDHIDHVDDGEWAYDENWVCRSCIDDNYVYSENRGTYVSHDDYDESEDEDNSRGIIGHYHESKGVLGHIPSKYDAKKPRILLGMELEVEVGDTYALDDKAEELYDNIKYVEDSKGNPHQYCFIESDGSLNNGFEVVTGYTGLDVHTKQLEFFKKPWRGVRSHDTRTCGLHVHIDKKDVSLFHACKMVFFINDSNNQKLIKDIARRANADYAQIKNKKASYQWLKRARASRDPLNYLNEERREALNFQNEKTIEFRLFKGTLRYETIMACLEFTYATWFFTRDTGVTNLTTPNFIDFICRPENRESTKFLRAYLREKNYVLPKLALVKPNPRSADYQPQPVEQLVA
jgi:hypothetical protein